MCVCYAMRTYVICSVFYRVILAGISATDFTKSPLVSENAHNYVRSRHTCLVRETWTARDSLFLSLNFFTPFRSVSLRHWRNNSASWIASILGTDTFIYLIGLIRCTAERQLLSFLFPKI